MYTLRKLLRISVAYNIMTATGSNAVVNTSPPLIIKNDSEDPEIIL